MHRKTKRLCGAATAALIILSATFHAEAQIQLQHQTPPYVATGDVTVFEFRAPGIHPDNISEVYFHYRYDGESSYRQQRAVISDNRIISEVRFDDHTSTRVEYYLSIEYIDGNTVTWPGPDAPAEPVQAELITEDAEESYDSITGQIDVTILSPEPGERLRPDDFVMAITLFYELAEAEADSFRVLLNGGDITGEAEVGPYLITWVPQESLPHGQHTLSLRYNSPEGQLVQVAEWDFRIVTREGLADRPAEDEPFRARNLIGSGRYQATARSQSYSERTTNLLRNQIRISGQQGSVNYTLGALLTTQEDPRLQPQNRYSAYIQAGNWLRFEAGHVYPTLNPYLIAGRRMRGIHTDLRFFSENIQFQFLHGELNRRITPLYRDLERDERLLGVDSQGNDITELSFLLRSQSGGSGTYTRDITGGRVGFGNGRPFGISFNALRVEDAMNSINVIRSFDDVPSDLMANLSQIDRDTLQANHDLLDVRAGNPRPQANFAFAGDLRLNLDNNRIQLRSDFAASLVNEDISDGVLDKNRADDLGFDLDEDIESLLDQLSWLIVINENMNVLPLKIRDEEAELFVPKGIFASQTRLNLNYFGHNAAFQYQWVGPEYRSLANVGQRRDVAGFTITDRFRLFTNTLYLTLGHENLKDNVVGNRDATTGSVTNRVSLGWYPRSFRLPRVTVGLRRRTRDNEFERMNPFLPDDLVKASVRNVMLVGDVPVAQPTPRNNVTMTYSASVTQRFFLFDLNHDAGLNYSYMTTDDRVFKYGNFTSNVFSFDLTSSFPAMPLRTNLGLNLNKTESGSGLNELVVWGFNTGISWYFLEDRFRLTTDLAMTFDRAETVPLVERLHDSYPAGSGQNELYWLYYEPDFDADVITEEYSASYMFSGGLRYTIHPQHNLQFRVNYTHLSDRHNVLNIPNNHLVQLNYVFDF